MKTSGKDSKESNRFRGRRAIEMYASTELSGCEICRICEVTESGFRCYLTKYHRELVLARYAILCSKEEAGQIKLGQLRGQLPATRVKYKDTIEACGSMEHIGLHVNSGWKARIWAGSAIGWVSVTGCRAARAAPARNSMLRPSGSCRVTRMSRCRRLPTPAGFPIPDWNSTCCSTIRIW
mgnify:CR=1 FL=1